MVRCIEKGGPAAKEPALAENANDHISFAIAQIHTAFQGNLTFRNDAYPVSEVTLPKQILACFVDFDAAKTTDLLNVGVFQCSEQLRVFQGPLNFQMIHGTTSPLNDEGRLVGHGRE
jgi:hypothetical protein